MIFLGRCRTFCSSVGTIEFNKVNYLNRVGQAIYYDTVPIWGRKSRKLTDFTTHFTLIIDTQGRSPYNGLTFFLAPATFQISPNSAGGFLGLFNTTYTDSPRNQLIVIEFDSFVNPEWDPPVEHVGINKNSIHPATYAAWDASSHGGETTDAWVSYNSTTQLLSLEWSYNARNDSRGNLSYQVDLREVLPEQVMIGFAAATGANVERHILQSWEFSSSLNVVKKGEDNSKKWKLAVGIGVPLGVLVLVAMAACVAVWRKKRKPAEEPAEAVASTSMTDNLERGAGPRRFSYNDLVSATNNFSNDRKLGEGGFGYVYKGNLIRENMDVAVKKVSQGSRQGRREYITEVKVISSLRH
uniref:Protein kinase domain-containing protein n=1 Tax=Helianthus annuus TaxID=4232 RepID=A0A251SJW3_HELAN